jgi:hypothetical protein
MKIPVRDESTEDVLVEFSALFDDGAIHLVWKPF